MPNDPSLVCQGKNLVSYDASTDPRERELVAAFLSTLGERLEIRDEQMNWRVGL
jgi:pyrroline-5-carboxylate reductase